ncbi:MAG TPA: hypothetical protein VFX65_02750 [Candidatus Limnocylindrales bacterium]|nr:hypothetical protein [Candidatus Limnocylindrales bacterium]
MIRRAARSGLVALVAGLAGPAAALAQTDPVPEAEATAAPPYILLLAAVLLAAMVVLAIRRPATRRWLAAGFVLGGGLLAAFYLFVAGALVSLDTRDPATPILFGLAVAAAVAGVALAVWIVRAGRHGAGAGREATEPGSAAASAAEPPADAPRTDDRP